MNTWSPDLLQKAWKFASEFHDGQKYGGAKQGQKVEYMVHIGNVTFEVMNAANYEENMDADLATQCAVLHDTLEDTNCTYNDIIAGFGVKVADGVLALTKLEDIDNKQDKMIDSLSRIKLQPKEIAMVKLADRISNLQEPPYYWNNEKIAAYKIEAELILKELQYASQYLANRLKEKIEKYINEG